MNPREQVAEALLAVARVCEPALADHLNATAILAERLARAMHLADEVVERCRIGGLLHDIGHLGLGRALVGEPRTLDPPEWEVVNVHPEDASDILLAIPSLADLAPIVRAHHERVDGTGYPDCLFGAEIPVESRIIAVGDAFHAMTVPSPYRNLFSSDSAFEELLGNVGSQFDERVVEAFVGSWNYRRRTRRYSA